MKLVAHIGTPKTGSTSIQRFLDANRERLVARGFYFLRSPGETNNASLPRCCLGNDKIDDRFFKRRGIDTLTKLEAFRTQVLRDLDDELRGLPSHVHTVITSSEHYYSRLRTNDEICRFRDVASKYFTDIEIVVYLRSQVDVAVSLYSTELKLGSSRTLREFVAQHCVSDNDYYNYYRTLKKWVEIFGKNKVSVRLFDRKEFINGDLLDDIVSQIAPELVGCLNKDVAVANESIDHVGQVVARTINTFIPQFNGRRGVDRRNQSLIKIVSDNFRGKGELLTDEQICRISSEFDECNKKLCDEFFPSRNDLFGVIGGSGGANGKVLSTTQEKGLRAVIEALIDSGPVLSEKSVKIIRDAAFVLEKHDLKMAYKLLRIVEEFKPDAPLIKKKLKAYRKSLKASVDNG